MCCACSMPETFHGTQSEDRMSDIAIFQNARFEMAKADALAELAARVRDWPLVQKAAEKKLEEIERLLDWWVDNVRGAGNQPINSGRELISRQDAEARSGYSQVQFSRWR